VRKLPVLFAATVCFVGSVSAQDGTSPPKTETATFKGSCMPNPPLANMVKARDKAKTVETPACNRAVVEWGKQVVFYKGDTEVLRFIGRKGEETDITMEQVQIRGGSAAPTTNGRCRFYRNENAGTVMAVCFAAFMDSKNEPMGAVAMFEGTAR
jgi:hypothetical protein